MTAIAIGSSEIPQEIIDAIAAVDNEKVRYIGHLQCKTDRVKALFEASREVWSRGFRKMLGQHFDSYSEDISILDDEELVAWSIYTLLRKCEEELQRAWMEYGQEIILAVRYKRLNPGEPSKPRTE